MPPKRVMAREFGMSCNAPVDAYGALATMDGIAGRPRHHGSSMDDNAKNGIIIGGGAAGAYRRTSLMRFVQRREQQWNLLT